LKPHNVLSAFGTSLLGVFSGLLSNLWLLREIVHVVSPHDFGVYALVFQITAYISIMQLGLDFSASREVAASLGVGNNENANKIFSYLKKINAWLIITTIFIIFCISSSLYFWNWGELLNGQQTRVLATKLTILLGTTQLIQFFTRPFSAALVGSGYQSSVNLITVFRTVFTTLIAYLFLKSGLYVYSVAIAEILMQIVGYFILRRMAYASCPWIQSTHIIQQEHPLRNAWMKYGLTSSLGGLAWTIESSSDVLILSYFTNLKIVAIYVIWWRLPMMLFDLCTRLSFSAFPKFAHEFGGANGNVVQLFGKIADVSLGLGALAFIGISLWLKPIIQIWIGGAYSSEVDLFLPFLMGLLVFLRVCGNLLGMYWLSSGRATLTSVLAWLQVGIKMLLVYIFVPTFGISGLVASSCFAALIPIFSIGYYLRKGRIVPRGYEIRAIALLLIAIPISLFGALNDFILDSMKMVSLMTLTPLVWGVIWCVVISTGDSRELLYRLVRKFSFIKF